MTVTEFRTQELPATQRFGYWHDLSANAMMPRAVTSDHEIDFPATLRLLDLGAVRVFTATHPSLDVRRTAKLIRRSDPESYQVALNLRGGHTITQAGRDTAFGRHDLVFYDSSRPFHGRLIPDEGGDVVTIVAEIPKALLPLPPDKVDQLLATRLSGRLGVGALLAQFLARLMVDAGQYRQSDGPRLETVALDLVVALLAHELDATSAVPPETHQRALTLRIQAFIRQHVHDPQLTPAVVAATHHISLRHLHRLFQAQGTTVAGWIRAQRLDRIRRDLADPIHRLTPVHELAARWGLVHPTAFSRTFRASYGLPPGEYRQHALRGVGTQG